MCVCVCTCVCFLFYPDIQNDSDSCLIPKDHNGEEIVK